VYQHTPELKRLEFANSHLQRKPYEYQCDVARGGAYRMGLEGELRPPVVYKDYITNDRGSHENHAAL